MELFVIADTHFGHRSLVEGRLQDDGIRLKMDGGRHTDFATVEEHDEAMVERWNAVVKPCDKVYHLGDVCMSKKSLRILTRLNGKKTLIAGNHDIFNTEEYMPYFSNMRGMRVIGSVLLSHVPVHHTELMSSGGRFRANVHGHLHRNFVLLDYNSIFATYANVCVEQTGYAPVPFDSLEAIWRS